MTVYNTAYETTVCANYRMQKTVEAIKEARIRDYLPSSDGVVRVESSVGAQSAIPAFTQPLFIGSNSSSADFSQHYSDVDTEGYGNGVVVAMDVRPSGRFDLANNNFKINNSTVYMSRMYRAVLTAKWLTQGPNAMRQLTPMATGVFANWVAEQIGFRYGLDPKARYDLMILAAIFYTSNHVNGEEFDSAQTNRYIAGISNALKFQVKDVQQVYDSVKLIGSIEDFCVKTVRYLDNVRLADFNSGVFVALMQSTWFGDNAKETVAVALEHPPTWLSILFEAYTNTMMKKTAIARICERRQYRDGLEDLMRAVRSMAPTVSKL